MKKFLLVVLFLFFGLALQAQEKNRFVYAIGGEALAISAYAVNFTIGEPLVGLVASNDSVDQGFWAGSLQIEPITESQGLNGIVVYPNPVNEELSIYADNNQIYGITLFAVNGKMALKQKVDATLLEHQIDVNHLAKGMYVLRLFIDDDNQEKLFKIIKN